MSEDYQSLIDLTTAEDRYLETKRKIERLEDELDVQRVELDIRWREWKRAQIELRDGDGEGKADPCNRDACTNINCSCGSNSLGI